MAARARELRQSPTNIRETGSQKVEISDDYFRKVPPRRKDWARSLGLCTEVGKLAPSGEQLLDRVGEFGLRTETGVYVIWPFLQEITNLRLNPKQLAAEPVDWWQVVKSGFVALGGRDELGSNHEGYREQLVHDLRLMFQEYRSLSGLKAMLRKEFPFLVFALAAASFALAKGDPLPPIPEFVDAERLRAESPLHIRSSRMNLSSIRFKAGA